MEGKASASPPLRVRSESHEEAFKEETQRKRVLVAGAAEDNSWAEEETLSNKQADKHSLLHKYSHLVDKAQGAAEFNREQSFLLLVQTKIDEQLDFLKQFRGRHRGETLRNIRRNLVESSKVYIDLKHIRQLLFIDPRLYAVTAPARVWNNDLLIGLPLNSNLPLRRNAFQHKMRDYIGSKDPKCSTSNEVEIPQCTEGGAVAKAKGKEDAPANEQHEKLNPLEILTVKNAQFKEKLFRMIREKEERLAVERGLYIKSKQYNGEERGAFLLEVHLVFMAANVSSMFLATLLDKMARKLHHATADMQALLTQLLQLCPQYIQKIHHPKGVILQTNRLFFMAAHKYLVTSVDPQPKPDTAQAGSLLPS